MAKKFLSDIELDAGLVDVNGNTGTSGQILSSTGSSVDWIDQGDIVINEAEVAKSLQVTVKNISGAQLTKGTVVHASPSANPPSGNVIEVIAADNDDPAKMPAIGILNETIADEAEGEAIMMGALSGIDTDSFAAGDELYVGADGALTNAKPTDADELIQKIAVVIKSHASNGLIKIFGAGRSNDIPNVGAATTDTDKFVVLDSGVLKYRTGAEIISDLSTDSRYVNVTGDAMTGKLGIGTSGPPTAYSLQTSSHILSGGSIYVGSTQNSIFDYFGTLHIYAGNGNSITLGGGVGSIQNDVSIGNGTFRVNGSTRMGTGNPTEKLDVDGNVKADGFTSDGNAYSYTWRALDSTGSSGTRYQKIARITSSQSSRFVIELAGRSTSYSNPLLPALGYIVGQLNNDNDYDLVFYNHSGEDTVVDEVGQVDVSTTQTDIYIKVSSFSEVTAHAHISDGSIAVESTSAGGTEPTNYVAATNITVWNSRNDGAGSGLDADTLDGQEASAFANSSHTHTWADISGEAANSVNSWGGLRHQTNDGYIDFGPANTSHAHIYTDRPDFYFSKRIQISGGSQLNASDVRSAIFYDLNNTAYYLNPASTSNLQELEILRNSSNYTVNLTDAHDRAGLMIKSSTNFDSKIAFSSGASSRQYIQALNNAHTTGRDIAINPYGGNVAIGKEAPAEALDVDGSITSNATIWTGYDCGVTNSISCSNWFRSSGSTGWFNATYSGGIHMSDSTWVRVYNNKKFYNQNTIESNSGMYAPIFYDRNNTNYRFHGDLSHNNVDLTSSGNYAIHVAGTISGGHRKHGNLETPEMEWSIGGSTDLNWKKLCDVVISDASYSGWGAEIEITDFSGNFGNATYNGGELFKGALSIYHWGGTGDTTETAYANIPYEMRSHVRWYKINESGQNRYQLQVKSPANYRQLYIKVKPGIGNQIADIISYANDTNGTTSGGTAYASIQNSNFNHEFAGGIWTNDTRDIGWKNSYGNPHLSSYYGAITTSASLYVGGPTSTTTQLYAGPVYGSVFYDRNSSTYYMDGSSTGDSIRVAGDVVAYYSSDKRYKENIKPIENALDKVKAINGVTFNWNEKSHKETGKKDVGVIAQEVEEVLPEIVETRRNGYKAVDYQKLTAVLIESVKELTAKVEALEAKQCNCK